MAEKHTVAMFVQDENGQRIQVGWASPANESGVRTFEYSPGFEGTSPKDVSFEDDELSQLVAEEQHESRTGSGDDGEEFEVEVQPTREDVSFGDFPAGGTAPQSVPQQAVTDAQDASPVEEAPDASQDAERVEDAPDEELADDATVELNSGGDIVDVAEEDEAPAQTRRELRENEENS